MEEEFFRNVMETYGPAVYRMALCRLQNLADAEDVYQDVFLRLLGEGDRPWENSEHLKAWLLRTALNRCTDLRRFRLRRPTLPLEAVPELACPADGGGAELWEAVGRLPEKLRVVVHLYYAEGYQTEEIAVMLQIPAATVRTRLRRGRAKLKDLLGGIDHEESVSGTDGSRICARRA